MINKQINNQKLGMSILHTHVENFLEATTASVYWKAANGEYLGVNNAFLKVAALKSESDLAQATDMDLIWADYASFMMKNDKAIVSSELTNTFIEPSITPKGKKIHYLSHKTPLRSKKNKVIGTFGLSYRLESDSWNLDRLNEISVLLGTKAADEVRKFLLTRQPETKSLTKRQLDCLYYLTKGMTIKEIAKSLSLSPRTVEHYLETIKDKLNCHSRSELFAKALTILVASGAVT